jgi:hypothetical protein
MAYSFAEDANMKQPVDYIDRIFKGDKPGNLLAQRPVEYELVINLVLVPSQSTDDSIASGH